jgi:hypothetical protein
VTGLFAITTQLRLVGTALVVLGVLHLGMARAFGWRGQLAGVALLTRQIIHAHTLFIGLTCVLLGLAPLLLTEDLLAAGRMSTAVLAAECVFWGLRWCAQLMEFRPALWRGNRLYTTGHICFVALWTWVMSVFLAALAARG